ncbi:MAG: hypothetical protein HPY59_11630 [Anaerolineae bacterium]|nr:hypothetical protein [Anaerolineae bacterium]
MKNRILTVENFLYLAAFVIAAGLRFVGLGRESLSDYEASLALQALALSRGDLATISPQPFYVLWTGFVFFLFESSNLLARLLPAFAGSIMTLGPYLYRKALGRNSALFLAFGLALSPALVGASRQADGLTFSLCFATLATGFFLNNSPAMAGIMAGLALLGGPTIWMLLFILGVVFLWGRLFSPRERIEGEPQAEEVVSLASSHHELPWRATMPWVLGSFLFAGTLFFNQLSGISAATSSLVSFFGGWSAPLKIGFAQFVIALVSGEALTFGLGLWALGRGWWYKNRLEMLLGRWFVVSLIFVLVYPSHRMIDAALVAIPLWCLASRQIERWFQRLPEERLPSFVLAAAILALYIFGWINIAGTPTTQELGGEIQLRWLSFAGAVIISLLMSVLVAWGWSPRVGGYGLRTGILGVLLIYLAFNAWSATGLGRQPAANPWRTAPYLQDSDLLAVTIEQFSSWKAMNRLAIDLTVVGVDSPGLKWLLRNHQAVQYVESIAADQNPSLVITPVRSSPLSGASYTGQDFNWKQSPAWSLMLPREWMKWLFFREAPFEREAIVLWVRSDLFPGVEPEPAENKPQ